MIFGREAAAPAYDPGVTSAHEGIVERLRAIEDELRDMAYDRLRDSLDTPAVLAEERRIHRARRAIEKAIHILDTSAADADVDPD